MKIRWIKIFFLIFLSSSAAQAQTTVTIETLGKGAKSCGTWNADRSTDDAAMDEEWVLGFVVAKEEDSNIAQTEDVTINTDQGGIFGWLDNYCKANPTKPLVNATDQFVTTVSPFVKFSD